MSVKKIIFLLSLLCVGFAAQAQSLVKDTRNLVEALDLINNRSDKVKQINAQMGDAVLTALRKYDRTIQADSSVAITGMDIMGPFAQQEPFQSIIATNTSISQLANSPTFDQADAASMQNDLRNILQLQKLALHQLGLLINDAKAKTLAILYSYTETLPGDSMNVGNWKVLLEKYQDNILFSKLIDPDVFNLQDSITQDFAERVHFYTQQITDGPREKILELLHAQNAINPADYLSVSKTLQEYSIPPVPQAMSLSIAAGETNTDVRNGFLMSEAAIIQGLFEFVLDRAKDEVVMNFLSEMVDSSEHPDLLQLFPTVVEEFSNQDFYYSTSYIERMRQAFYQDIQLMTIRLPDLLLTDGYFSSLQGDPVAYDLLSIFSMLGMAKQGATIDEIFPVTHRYIYSDYGESSKETNLTVAENGIGKPEYDKLINISNDVKTRLKTVYQSLANAEAAVNTELNNLKSKYPNATGAPLGNDYLGRPAYSLKVLLGEAEEDNEYDLFLLPSLLKGELDSAYVVGFTTIEGYDKFFTNEKTAVQWRAAGLELSRRLNGTWYNDQSLADILETWQKDLVRFKSAVDNWGQQIDTADLLQKAISEVELDRQALFQTIQADKKFWSDSIGLTHDQNLAFTLLENLAGINAFTLIDFDPQYFAMIDTDPKVIDQLKLQRKQTLLGEIQDRLTTLDQRLRDENDSFFFPSPLQIFLTEKNMTSTPYGYIIPQVDAFEDALGDLEKQLMVVDKAYAPLKSKIRNNAIPILQTTGVMSQLLYGLRTDSNEEGERWLNKEQLAGILNGGTLQNVFLGLLTERFANVKQIGAFSTKGVGQLIQLTIAELDNLPSFIEIDSLGQTDSLAFFHRAAFAVNTLNRVLELPLVVDPANPGTFEPLKERYDGLAKVPDISTQALDFIYYVNSKNHGRAISTLIQLFTSLDYQSFISDPSQPDSVIERRTAAIEYLKKYGNFIAGIIDAQDSDEVKDLLDNIADPPGSSKTKRIKKTTVGINAFLGASIGGETWDGGPLGSDGDTFASVAPSMPIGFAISHLFGKKQESFSLFLSLIDLGGLFSYRIDADAIGEDNINFKNVFKPGFQIQWNLRKSPFYIGAGGNFGPQFRTLNNEVITLNSKRFFISFGIDVPVFTLYSK